MCPKFSYRRWHCDQSNDTSQRSDSYVSRHLARDRWFPLHHDWWEWDNVHTASKTCRAGLDEAFFSLPSELNRERDSQAQYHAIDKSRGACDGESGASCTYSTQGSCLTKCPLWTLVASHHTYFTEASVKLGTL